MENLTGIPIHCSMLNKLIEIHAMQRTLPDRMLALFIKELDERNIDGRDNQNRLLNSIEKSNLESKRSLIDYVENSVVGLRAGRPRRTTPNDEFSRGRNYKKYVL